MCRVKTVINCGGRTIRLNLGLEFARLSFICLPTIGPRPRNIIRADPDDTCGFLVRSRTPRKLVVSLHIYSFSPYSDRLWDGSTGNNVVWDNYLLTPVNDSVSDAAHTVLPFGKDRGPFPPIREWGQGNVKIPLPCPGGLHPRMVCEEPTEAQIGVDRIERPHSALWSTSNGIQHQ